MIRHFAFTIDYPKIVKNITTAINIGYAASTGPINDNVFSANALWDTGATSSVISQKLAYSLNLMPISFKEVNGVHGSKTCPVYIVDFYLPNGIRIKDIVVIASDGFSGFDILIGMDIISLGSIAISIEDNKTTFSYVVPSMGKIDFVPDSNMYNSKAKQP